jgi:hypothetical protein
MDPTQTYEDFLSALQKGDIDAAAHRADDLTCWVRRGGLVPGKLLAHCGTASEVARFLSGATVVLAWAASDLAAAPDQPG